MDWNNLQPRPLHRYFPPPPLPPIHHPVPLGSISFRHSHDAIASPPAMQRWGPPPRPHSPPLPYWLSHPRNHLYQPDYGHPALFRYGFFPAPQHSKFPVLMREKPTRTTTGFLHHDQLYSSWPEQQKLDPTPPPPISPRPLQNSVVENHHQPSSSYSRPSGSTMWDTITPDASPTSTPPPPPPPPRREDSPSGVETTSEESGSGDAGEMQQVTATPTTAASHPAPLTQSQAEETTVAALGAVAVKEEVVGVEVRVEERSSTPCRIEGTPQRDAAMRSGGEKREKLDRDEKEEEHPEMVTITTFHNQRHQQQYLQAPTGLEGAEQKQQETDSREGNGDEQQLIPCGDGVQPTDGGSASTREEPMRELAADRDSGSAINNSSLLAQLPASIVGLALYRSAALEKASNLEKGIRKVEKVHQAASSESDDSQITTTPLSPLAPAEEAPIFRKITANEKEGVMKKKRKKKGEKKRRKSKSRHISKKKVRHRSLESSRHHARRSKAIKTAGRRENSSKASSSSRKSLRITVDNPLRSKGPAVEAAPLPPQQQLQPQHHYSGSSCSNWNGFTPTTAINGGSSQVPPHIFVPPPPSPPYTAHSYSHINHEYSLLHTAATSTAAIYSTTTAAPTLPPPNILLPSSTLSSTPVFGPQQAEGLLAQEMSGHAPSYGFTLTSPHAREPAPPSPDTTTTAMPAMVQQQQLTSGAHLLEEHHNPADFFYFAAISSPTTSAPLSTQLLQSSSVQPIQTAITTSQQHCPDEPKAFIISEPSISSGTSGIRGGQTMLISPRGRLRRKKPPAESEFPTAELFKEAELEHLRLELERYYYGYKRVWTEKERAVKCLYERQELSDGACYKLRYCEAMQAVVRHQSDALRLRKDRGEARAQVKLLHGQLVKEQSKRENIVNSADNSIATQQQLALTKSLLAEEKQRSGQLATTLHEKDNQIRQFHSTLEEIKVKTRRLLNEADEKAEKLLREERKQSAMLRMKVEQLMREAVSLEELQEREKALKKALFVESEATKRANKELGALAAKLASSSHRTNGCTHGCE